MKTHLLYPDKDFDPENMIINNQDIVFDMELDIILDVMGGGDPFIRDISRTVLMNSLTDPKEIEYRHAVLKDFMANGDFFLDLYELICRTVDYRTNMRLLFKPKRATGILRDSIKVMNSFIDCLVEIRGKFDKSKWDFESQGIKNLIALIDRVITDDYVESVKHGLNTLRFRSGVECSMGLSESLGMIGARLYPKKSERNLFGQVVGHISGKEYNCKVSEQDDLGKKTIAQIKDVALSRVAGVMEESRDHILSFFSCLQNEMAFYLGCLNLRSRMEEIDLDFSFPQISPEGGDGVEKTSKLYDLALALQMRERVVANDIDATGKKIVVITGANQGGKTTYLRSRGQAQLMMQAGMFVAADACKLHCVNGFFTHFKREENDSSKDGRLADELKRMDDIVEQVKPGSMVMFNESFTSTNEVEASRINLEITKAFLRSGVKVIHVTHLYQFADDLGKGDDQLPLSEILFLRASRDIDGSRSFKLEENPPLKTGYARDIYDDVFKI